MNKYYIVIPTRNRADVFFKALKTALMQTYENLEIIVSDNSTTNTLKDKIVKINDPRISYYKTVDKCMMNSWEFALSHVKEPGFVHMMGDDNGLTPNTIEYVDSLVKQTGLKIVLSNCIQYHWPDEDGAVELTIPLKSGYTVVNARSALKNAFNMRRGMGFSLLPTINVAFIHTSIIDFARKINGGRYFCASNPDVYSSVINAACVDKYIYSSYPFVINGASSHSTGRNSGQNISSFDADNLKDGYEYFYPFLPSKSYYLGVYEAFAVAGEKINNFDPSFNLRLNYVKVLNRMIQIEYLNKNKYWIKESIQQFAENIGVKPNIPKIHKRPHQKAGVRSSFNYVPGFELYLKGQFGITDVHQASILSHEIFLGASNGQGTFLKRLSSVKTIFRQKMKSLMHYYYFGVYKNIWLVIKWR